MVKTRLFTLLRGAKKYIILNVMWQWLSLILQIFVVGLIAHGFWAVMGPVLRGEGLNAVNGALLWKIPVFVIPIILLRGFFDSMAARASYEASADVKKVLREKIYEKLLSMGASYKEQISTSEVVQLSTEGVEQLETYFGRYLPQLFYSMLAPITLFIVLSFVNMKASVVLLICVPLIPLSIVAVQKVAKRLLSKYWGMYTGLGDSFLENLQGLTTLKIYQADQEKADQMDAEAQNFRRITMKVLTMQLNSTSVMDIVAYGGAAVGMIVAVREFMDGRLDLVGTMIIVLLASEFFIPLRVLGSFFHIAMNGMAASDKIFALLDKEVPEKGTKSLPEGKMDVSFSGVRFSYEKDREILRGVDLLLPSGSFAALVGESGCGKSTIAGILAGKNRNYTGEILINGMPLSDVKEAELMEKVTLIRHNSYLFKGTVRDNLLMAKADATDKEMEEALKKVNLYSFLWAHKGLDTPLLEWGSNFSGGQCQRLALARALLHDTPVYIFDEATSNIDAESEEMIMEVVHELSKTHTVLLISHRLSNVVQADCIYMLRDGVAGETGTHEELMRKKGSYAELFSRQAALEQYGKAVTE